MKIRLKCQSQLKQGNLLRLLEILRTPCLCTAGVCEHFIFLQKDAVILLTCLVLENSDIRSKSFLDSVFPHLNNTI